MPPRKELLAHWLRERAPTRVELADFDELLEKLAPVTESALRHLLRDAKTPLHPLVAGVDQETFQSLRETLNALADAYTRGTAETRRLTRHIVITAKDHARLAARNPRVDETKRRQKAEMAAWMLTWLENPELFPLWIDLRFKSLKLD